jgi:hypothetical protein
MLIILMCLITLLNLLMCLSQFIFMQGVFLSQAIKVNLIAAFKDIFPVDAAVISCTLFCQSVFIDHAPFHF